MKLDMIGILTNNFNEMKAFYKDVLNFKIKQELDNFVEFESDSIRFAISTNEIMHKATDHIGFTDPKQGHSFELAFRVETPDDVDKEYANLINNGAKGVNPPKDMPWGQRTAFFGDPDGNIHEVFSDIPK